MADLSFHTCQKCANALAQDQIYMNFYSCKNCGFNGKIDDGTTDWSVSMKKKIFFFFLSLISLFALRVAGKVGWETYQRNRSVNFNDLSLSEVQNQLQVCHRTMDHKCLKEAYLRLSELEPDTIDWKANVAFQMTDLGEHEGAVQIYRSILAKGVGTYDLLYNYGRSLRALGRIEESLQAFSKSYSIHNRHLDVIEALTETLVEVKRHDEALSLLQEFAELGPDAQAAVKGRIAVISDMTRAVGLETPKQEIKLLAPPSRHHFAQIQLGTAKLAAIVDTGASLVTFSSATAKEALTADELGKAKSAKFKTANGQIVNAKVTRARSLFLNGIEVQNVEVGFCDSCENLAGRSLLSKI